MLFMRTSIAPVPAEKAITNPHPKLVPGSAQCLDKAKAVDPAMQKQNEEQRKEIEKQEQ